MSKIMYTKDLLKIVIERDEFNLIEQSEKYTRDSIIFFICKCGKEHNKLFRNLYNSGGFCIECSKTNKPIIEKSALPVRLTKYTLEYLNDIMNSYKCEIDISKYDKIMMSTIIEFICNCGKSYSKKIQQIDKSGAFCYTCTNTTKNEKTKQACLEKYGVESPLQCQQIKDKIKNTCLEKYGVESPLQCEKVKEKHKSTCLKKYGVSNISQSQEVKNKKIAASVEKYGVSNISQSQEVKDKKSASSVEKYGTMHVFQSQDIKDKGKKTCLEKYGCEHPNQNADQAEKVSKKAYKLKDYTFPCGSKIKVQGYENWALDDLGLKFDEVNTSRKEVPEIWWEDSTSKKHRYFVDIFIPSLNKMIEVKSTWTYKKKTESIYLKALACIQKGFQYELWIYDDKRNKQVITEFS